MAVDERARHQLFLRVEQEPGPEAAETMMELLPPVGWADVATKDDIRQLEERMALRFEALEERMGARFESFGAICSGCAVTSSRRSCTRCTHSSATSCCCVPA